MTALYWEDFDCTPGSRGIEHGSTVHMHFDDERTACLQFIQFIGISVVEWVAERRYYCIRGPRGLVRGIKP